MSNRKKTIKDVCELILGYTFRKELQKNENGQTVVLQARNILESLKIYPSNLLRVEFGNSKTNALVKNNDVVLSSRGSFKASVAKIGSETVVAAASVYLLRLKTSEILPEYLCIYLNSERIQKKLGGLTTGVVISALLKSDLETLEVVIPSLENQQKIVDIYFNNLHYKKLLDKKLVLSEEINKELINKLINS